MEWQEMSPSIKRQRIGVVYLRDVTWEKCNLVKETSRPLPRRYSLYACDAEPELHDSLIFIIPATRPQLCRAPGIRYGLTNEENPGNGNPCRGKCPWEESQTSRSDFPIVILCLSWPIYRAQIIGLLSAFLWHRKSPLVIPYLWCPMRDHE